MGYRVEGQCWDSIIEANNAHYGKQPSQIIPKSDGTFAIVEFQAEPSFASGWERATRQYNASGTYTGGASAQVMQLTWPTCDPFEPMLDGITMGWGIATALVLAQCVVMIRRAAR